MTKRRSSKKASPLAALIIVGLILVIGVMFLSLRHTAMGIVKTTGSHAEDLAYGSHQVLLMQSRGKECRVWPVRFNELVAQHQADRAHIDALIAEGHAAGC